jgi:hypothetical protein
MGDETLSLWTILYIFFYRVQMALGPHTTGTQIKERLVTEVPAEWMRVIDQLRGRTSRSEWVRQTLLRAFYRRRISGLPAVADRRGCWDRLERGKMTPARADRERRRRKRNAYMRRWRTVAANRPKPVPPGPEFLFLNDGGVAASDLIGSGCEAGFVDAHGTYRQSSRHGATVVRQALAKAMAADPQREWPERFRRFLSASS